jgi:hypothetical protein
MTGNSNRDAEVLLHGGTIYTMTELASVEAVLIRGDRIAAVGTLQQCRAASRGTAREINLVRAVRFMGRLRLGSVAGHPRGDRRLAGTSRIPPPGADTRARLPSWKRF